MPETETTDRPPWLIILQGGGYLDVPAGSLTVDAANALGTAIPGGEMVPPRTQTHPHVYAAIAAVMEEMPAVPKDGVMSDGGNWHYRGIEGITAAIQHIMGRHGVVPIPHVISREVESLTRGQGSKWTLDTMHIAYRLYGPGGHEDRTDEIGPFVCLGLDNSDKGTNKAMTMGLKQMLLQVFVIGNGTDDPDAHNTEARPAGQQEQPLRLPTIEEWAAMNGWGDDPEDAKRMMDAAKAEVRAAINAGDFDDETKRLLWRDYNHPDGHEADENGEAPRPRPRRMEEHIAWWKANIETEDNPLDPPHAENPSSPVETAQEPPADEPETNPLWSRTEPPAPAEPVDDEWAKTMRQGGIDAVIAKMAATPSTGIIHALQARGQEIAVPTDFDALRRQLGGLVFAESVQAQVKVETAPPAEDPPSGEPEPNLPASREHIGSAEGSKLHAYATRRSFSPEEFKQIVLEMSLGRTDHARLLNAAEAVKVRTELNTRPLPTK